MKTTFKFRSRSRPLRGSEPATRHATDTTEKELAIHSAARSYHRNHQTELKAASASRHARAETLELMEAAKLKKIEIPKGGGCPALIAEITYGRVGGTTSYVDVSKALKLLGEKKLLEVASITQAALLKVAGTRILQKCLVTVKGKSAGTKNVTIYDPKAEKKPWPGQAK